MAPKWSPLVLMLAGCLPLCGQSAGVVQSANSASGVVRTDATANSLTPIARARAQLWELSPVEWRRYESLMTGIRGSISPASISPIEVLGIHARDDDERRKYAERWAEMMREDVDRILAFQRAYDAAGRRLYPNEQIVADVPGRQMRSAKAGLSAQDRLLLFTTSDCAPCDVVLREALDQIDRVAGIDIYLGRIASTDTAGVRAWAARHGIAPEWVRSGRVTLNFEAGTLARLGRASAALPVLLRRRGETIASVTSAELR